MLSEEKLKDEKTDSSLDSTCFLETAGMSRFLENREDMTPVWLVLFDFEIGHSDFFWVEDLDTSPTDWTWNFWNNCFLSARDAFFLTIIGKDLLIPFVWVGGRDLATKDTRGLSPKSCCNWNLNCESENPNILLHLTWGCFFNFFSSPTTFSRRLSTLSIWASWFNVQNRQESVLYTVLPLF